MFMNQKLIAREKKARLENGTLAGSMLTMEQAIKTMVQQAGLPLTDAVRIASVNGGQILWMEDRKGILAVCKDADIVLLNDGLEVQAIILR